MRSEDFESLDNRYKTETVLKATFLSERFTEAAYIRLYSYGKVYIEVFVDCRSNLIVHFHAFEPTRFLLPYLKTLTLRYKQVK